MPRRRGVEQDSEPPVYKPYGNNSLFRMRRSASGKEYLVEQFCTAPVDAELTGPTFTDDGSTLFLSVQHPGICAKTGETRSRWPPAGAHPNDAAATATATNQPRSAVVAIRRIR